MQILFVWFLSLKKRRNWKQERNKHYRAGRASCFVWRIEAQHHCSPVITQESRVREKKTGSLLKLLLAFFYSVSRSLYTLYFSLLFFGFSSAPNYLASILSPFPRQLKSTPWKTPLRGLLKGLLLAYERFSSAPLWLRVSVYEPLWQPIL